MNDGSDELVFVPLGGLGEIGMNLALYGFGRKGRIKWLMVDCGVAFAGPDLPGIDLMVPDISFIEKMRDDLAGLVITHAHEDHIGAVADLWPTAWLHALCDALRGRACSKRSASPSPARRTCRSPSSRRAHRSPSDLSMSNSLPWRIRFRKAARLPSARRSARFFIRAIGKSMQRPELASQPTRSGLPRSGRRAFWRSSPISTNILREGFSPSEADVAKTLREIIGQASGRVVVTTFASNVARIRAVAEAAVAAGRSVVMAGRAMERVTAVARECGYLDGIGGFFTQDAFPISPATRWSYWQPEAKVNAAPRSPACRRALTPWSRLIRATR